MFGFFKKKVKEKLDYEDNAILKIASLLIHAAKIDENYSSKEKYIIKKTLINLGANKTNIDKIIDEAEKKEKESNQMIDFTKEIKNLDINKKEKIIQSLWSIIYSDKVEDMYESNLMRRLSGLLYLDEKTVGKIKEIVKLNNKK